MLFLRICLNISVFSRDVLLNTEPEDVGSYKDTQVMPHVFGDRTRNGFATCREGKIADESDYVLDDPLEEEVVWRGGFRSGVLASLLQRRDRWRFGFDFTTLLAAKMS